MRFPLTCRGWVACISECALVILLVSRTSVGLTPISSRSRSAVARSSSGKCTPDRSPFSVERTTKLNVHVRDERRRLRLASSSQSYLSYLENLSNENRTASRDDAAQRSWLGKDLANDWKQRLIPYYLSDWKEGFDLKILPPVLFLYFACIFPAVAFGGIAYQVTGGSLGVIEYLIACGASGMVFAAFSGQPMTLIGPTGLTLAFMTALYGFTSSFGLPFLPIYSWCGLWTCAFMVLMSLAGTCNLVNYATQFTDDVFNALLALNFLYEASRSLLRNFQNGQNKGTAFLALNLALLTYGLTRKSVQARNSQFFNQRTREFISDSGPVVVIVLVSLLTQLPALLKVGVEFLHVPPKLILCGGRSLLSPLFSVPLKIQALCAVPAMLLTSLFFLDQNISSRVVNSPKHKMVKPPAYHQDLLVLGMITGVLSVFGLPWQCAATVQSLNHVRALSVTEVIQDSDGKRKEVVTGVCENRVTGFSIHALILLSVTMLPILKYIPMPVVSGIFLYLGRTVMSGNGFLIRIKELFFDSERLDPTSAIKRAGYSQSVKYTAVQVAMLSLLWTLKSFQQTALFFPSVIGLLVIVRLTVLPKMFSKKTLNALDSPVA